MCRCNDRDDAKFLLHFLQLYLVFLELMTSDSVGSFLTLTNGSGLESHSVLICKNYYTSHEFT